jgi:hypothetical protein
MIRDELTQAVEMGVISFDMSTRVGMEIDHLRTELELARVDIARKSRLIEALRAQVSALEALEVFGRLVQLADKLDAQDKAGTQ